MKKYLKGYLIGFLSAIILLGSILVFADNGFITISVVLNKINLSINGAQVAKSSDTYTLDNGTKVPFSILYNGTTYLPMRKVASIVGKEVLWDPATATVSLNDASYIPPLPKPEVPKPEIPKPEVPKPAVQSIEQLTPQLSLSGDSPYRLTSRNISLKSSTTLWNNQEDTYGLASIATGKNLGTLTVKQLNLPQQPEAYLHITFQATPETLDQPKPLSLKFQLGTSKENFTITNLNPGAGPVFYQSPTQSLVISSLQTYKTIQKGAYQRLTNPPDATTFEKNTLQMNFPITRANLSEYWLMLSPNQLVNPQDQTEMNLLKRMNFDQNRQWSSLGNLDPVPSNYEGAIPNLFWSNYGYHIGNKLLLQGTSPFSRVYALVAAQHLLSRYPESGFFLTPFSVDWLKVDYGIETDFYDTRFNSDAAQFLANLALKYDLKEAKTALDHHIKFFKTYASKNSFLYEKAGFTHYLPMDYANFTSTQVEGQITQVYKSATNHASFNHVLAQVTLLYNHYQLTGDETSKQLGNDLIEKLSALGRDWIKPNGDLWYAYHPSKGFILQDYIDVTLNDLYTCQEIYKRVNGKTNDFLEDMTLVKEAYVASLSKKIE